MRGVSVRTALLGVMLAVTVGAVGSIYLGAYQVAERNTVELSREKAGLIVHTIRQQLHAVLEPVDAQLRHAAATIAADPALARDTARVDALLGGVLAATPQVAAAGFAGPDLRIRRVFRNRPDGTPDEADWSGDARFAATMARLSAAPGPLSEAFVAEPTGEAYLSFFRPVAGPEGFAGAVVASIPVRGLSRFLRDLGREYDVRPFVLRGDRLLAHPWLADNAPAISDAAPLVALGEVDDPVLARLLAGEGAEGRLADAAPAEQRAINGRDYLLLHQRVADFGEPDWQVGAYVPLRSLVPQLRRVGWLPWIAAAVLVLAGLAALLASRAIARPIRSLAEASQHVRELDLDGAPTLATGTFREINEAVQAYNAMVRGLRSFAAYVPRHLVLHLLGREGGGHPRSQDAEISVMFTDIVGFTALAERLPAPEVVALLNDHFGIVDEQVEAEAGIVDKYIGDAALAFWGAPEATPDHALRCCRAARGIARAIHADNLHRRAAGKPPIRLRIGIHSGRAVVGTLGGAARLNYTIIGDTVNVAERVESLAREAAPAEEEIVVLLSGETARRLDGRLAVEPLGSRHLRGRRGAVEVFRLVTRP